MLPVTAKENEPSSSSLAMDQICQHFTLDAIRLATLNFSEGMVIGRGGFGKVYKGHFHQRSDVAVAIKRLHSMSNQGAPEFQAELEMLSKLRHCNLVSLIGYCSEGTEMALVYDYMPHGTLEDHLYKSTAEELFTSQAQVIRKTSYGTLYLATMESGKQLTVRRMSDTLVKKEHFAQGKIHALGKLGHTNILRLIAYFTDSDSTLFISDHIKNGVSVASFLQFTERQRSKLANYLIRKRMIAGITRGLVYLHTQENMVHGYLTSENVMLDYNYNPLIADVGLSMFTRDILIPSQFRLNFAPELSKLEQANKKYYIYSLGYIMLELLTEKIILTEKITEYSKANENRLVACVNSVPREDLIAKVVNHELLFEESNLNQELVCLVELAMVCVSESPNSRPNADQVLQQLDDILSSDPSIAREASDGVLAMPDKLFCVSAS